MRMAMAGLCFICVVSALLDYAFSAGLPPPCVDATDVDDNGSNSAFADTLALLRWGFVAGEAPPAPGAYECGLDSTADNIDCAEASPGCM